MPRLTPVHWKVLECIFKNFGFTFEREGKNHLIYSKDGINRPIVILKYNQIDIDIILNNMRTAKMSRDKYFELLNICK